MAKYKEGSRYLRNRVTGAVFQYRPSLAGMADLVEMVGAADNTLEAVANRPAAVDKLNPTKTPEKTDTAKPAVSKQAGSVASKPTLKPVDVK